MGNDFDTACRRMVKNDPVAFLTWLVTDFVKTARFLRWIDTRSIPFPGKADQTGDLVAELELLMQVQPLWAFALVFQLEPDPEMFGRMLEYLGRIWRERRPDPLRGSRYQLLSSVVNLLGTSASQPTSVSFVWPGPDAIEVRLLARERYLAEESAEGTLEAIASAVYDRALLPWVPLMRGGSEPAVIARWIDLATREPDGRRQADLGYHALVFAEKCADPKAWQTALEGWGMIKSQAMEQTRAEGRVEGRVEGRNEGAVLGRQEMLLDVLRLRSGEEVPSDLADPIHACSDEAQLRAWLAVAVGIDTLGSFRQQTGL